MHISAFLLCLCCSVDRGLLWADPTFGDSYKWPLRFVVKTETKLRGFGPIANYADRATAARWRSSANFLRIEGVAWSEQRIPTVVNLGFLDRSRYYFFQVSPQLSSRG
jgi:hypothetical protein